MAERRQYEELARHLNTIGAVKRGIARALPADCPAGSAVVLALLRTHGEMRISRLAELMGIDMSVTSRHVAHVAERGWIERIHDPSDKRSRILRLTPAGRELLGSLNERVTEMFAHNLSDWSDDDVGRLNTLLARLRDSFACRCPGGCAPGKHLGDCRSRPADSDDDAHTRTPV